MQTLPKSRFTVTAQTKRNPPIISGKRGKPVVNIDELSCTPLDPAAEEVILRAQLETPMKVLQTYTLGTYDIREGDIFVVGSNEYPIASVSRWECSDGTLYEIVLEDVKVSGY